MQSKALGCGYTDAYEAINPDRIESGIPQECFGIDKRMLPGSGVSQTPNDVFMQKGECYEY